MRYFNIFVIFIYYGLPCISAQEGVPCKTPNEEYGICINIHNCTKLRNLLKTQQSNSQVRTFLKSSICGYVNKIPMVCCPLLPKIPDCGFSNASNPRIVNGIPAKLGEFPWLVALGYKNSKNPNLPKWKCGGTLITERHILTAAHCVHNQTTLYTVRLGDLDLVSNKDGANPETIPIVKMKIHERYSHDNRTNDIAILTLERSPRETTARPICLPLDEPLRFKNYVNTKPTVAGWGMLYFEGPTSPILQQVHIPVVDNSQCSRPYRNISVIDSRVMCAGYSKGGKDACGGDSGGPLMHREANGRKPNLWYYQIGIVSYGKGCAEAGYPGVYTRVTAFLDWIQNNLN